MCYKLHSIPSYEPASSLLNLHYWDAQYFVVATCGSLGIAVTPLSANIPRKLYASVTESLSRREQTLFRTSRDLLCLRDFSATGGVKPKFVCAAFSSRESIRYCVHGTYYRVTCGSFDSALRALTLISTRLCPSLECSRAGASFRQGGEHVHAPGHQSCSLVSCAKKSTEQ